MSRLSSLAIALVFLCAAGCGGAKSSGSTPAAGSGSAGMAVYPKKVAIGWGIGTAAAGKPVDVFLQLTDETGRQTSFPAGSYPGPCAELTPAPEMHAMSGVACATVQLHAVLMGREVIVLKLALGGGTPDPMAREEVTRTTLPADAMIDGVK